MKKLTIGQIVQAVDGKLLSGDTARIVSHVATDSRKVETGSIFFAIKGENHDAHKFLPQVFEAGCMAAVVSDGGQAAAACEGFGAGEAPAVILVDDTVAALGALAKYYLSTFSIHKLAVTGSTGKTSTKDMLYYICSEKYKTVRTEGNFNNEIGLPLTVFSLEEDTEAAIFEMGMDGAGQIHALADIVRPETAIITNVGISHMERLGSREGILKAKLEITDFFTEENLLVISNNGDVLTAQSAAGSYRLETIGFDGHSGFIISDIDDRGAESISFTVEHEEKAYRVKLGIGGSHNAVNASLAMAAALSIGITMEEAVRGLEKMELTDKRLSIRGRNGIKVIDDTYNASPDSMKAGLDVLASTKGIRHAAILGDMFELGENSQKYHREVGRYAAEKKLDLLIAIGSDAAQIAKGAADSGMDGRAIHFETKDDFLKRTGEFIKTGDVVLVKGSRGMKMEEIVNKILE